LLHTEQADRVDTLCPTRHAVSDIKHLGDIVTTLQEHIGANVKAFRGKTSPRELGAALAFWLGKPWTRQAVWEAENGKRVFTAAELLALAAALDVTLPQLFESADKLVLPSGRSMPATVIDALVLGTNKERDRMMRLLGSARALKRAKDELQVYVLGLDMEVRELEGAIHGAPIATSAGRGGSPLADTVDDLAAKMKSASWRKPHAKKLRSFEAIEAEREEGERNE
jgi:transcriptional regulator with XRE-family HTH domain